MLDNMWQKNLDENIPAVARIKTLVDKVNIIHNVDSNILEQEVDTFTQTLLFSAGMDDYPLSTNPRSKLFTEIGENRERITSIPDFLIRSKKIKTLTVIEDKNSNDAIFANQWMENLVLGEMFVAAHNIKVKETFDVFGVRIIGSLFTFFRATITPEYIKESSLGLPIKNHMKVLRYPDPGDDVHEINALDFCKLEGRKIIIKYLERIRESLLKISTP
ncbi:hypothetical protein CONCODRAFT_168632 [Conidiobolus coronatus NRRL 28638]|uniref:Fungal-type protein kinase domain-containing protein n=1 Tax=Conidiobolus coronatus (strain ATCC 28846 / CBS 209.66 / NRRL 28638) TaxID=796925 RepID=A0A137NTT6_CONC2|nr:hypothetical protein CONCODRAFT_168632 [Conidiobolus coronatus NRRL 28638]|eukprot:KXN66149.1 hypothetical protein CONCODRAFT_168632 [Conidiobolus coronatus NRRL 28638]